MTAMYWVGVLTATDLTILWVVSNTCKYFSVSIMQGFYCKTNFVLRLPPPIENACTKSERERETIELG